MNLLSTQTVVESPFIIMKIGDYTFGSYSRKKTINNYASGIAVTFPNFMESIQIKKVNGQINSYTIQLIYQIAAGDDPNMLDKIFSSIANIGENSRKITLSYGDWNSPTFIYREESALILSIRSSVDFQGSKITYTLTCISDALPLTANYYTFQGRVAKPSDVIKELLYNKQYGITDIFYGMTNIQDVLSRSLIASDDRSVELETLKDVNILDYLNYLVNSMSCVSDDPNSLIKSYKYSLCIIDDVKGELNGPYFKVVKVATKSADVDSPTTYEIDIGYPGDNFVTQFSLKDDQSWSLLYQYSDKVKKPNYIYKMDEYGRLVEEYSPSVMVNNKRFKVTETDKTWWTNMTQFPVTATLTIKGLLRPSMLMTYIRVNAYFYGRKHTASGLYAITEQNDVINSSGYRTTLSLMRIGGDVDK